MFTFLLYTIYNVSVKKGEFWNWFLKAGWRSEVVDGAEVGAAKPPTGAARRDGAQWSEAQRSSRLLLIPFKSVGLVQWAQSLFELWVLRQFKKGLI